MPELIVEGLADVQRAFAKADRATRLGLRAELRDIAEPVAHAAEGYAVDQISHIGKKWWKMRVGVVRKAVYVAPRERGRKRNVVVSRARRKADLKFAAKLMERAMEPALEREAPHIEERVERTLDRVADRFNTGAHL